MSRTQTLFSAALMAIALCAALPENAAAQVTVRPGGPAAKPHLEPCWQVAGVSKSAIQERRAIERQAHQQIEAVCANSSLSAQQKREQMRQIHQQEKQQIEGIITPAQQEAMKSCQQSRGHGGHPHAGGGHGGPCGELSSPHKTNPPEHEEDEMPPDETSHPN
jgi:hypothetical protein